VDANDLILVSVDDHVIEPRDMFDRHLPARYRDRAPRVVDIEGGSEAWEFAGQRIVTFGLNAVAGTPPEEYGIDPTRYDQMRPGCYDIHERVRDMNAGGVLGSICFPTMPRFCGQVFLEASRQDAELALATCRAYNDWHVEDWCGAYPGRFIPIGCVPLWDAELAAQEVRRLAASGCHAVTFSENPEKLGLPSLYKDDWDPFWAACSNEGTVVCLHIGSSSSMVVTTPDAPVDVPIVLSGFTAFMALADLLYSPAFTKFPDLKVAMSEGGIGWVPYLLERADYVYAHHHAWTGTTLGGKKPSERFREHVTTCFIDDAAGVRDRDLIGVDRITWEQDYPHSDSTWPTGPETLWPRIADLPEDVIAKITHENAMRLFRYDPFAHRPKESCTVGALRAEATDVDVAPRTMNRTKSVDAAELLTLAGPKTS
jgi:predicted TIM-barrel fold metal-dependent hydrolase